MAETNIKPFTSQLNDTEEIIADFREGKMVVMVDDEDRENEGDILIPAECVTPEVVNFLVSHARGLVCLALTQERCRQLNLPLMANKNNARYSTNFTVSVEAAHGVTTGISAADRSTTILAAVNPKAKPEDLVYPGHIFPLMAQPGGVLSRAGHTEAGVDLARLAGREQASVICEIINHDGSMARLPDLLKFAKKYQLKIGTIANLIRYRLDREPTVYRVEENRVKTSYGTFRLIAYQDIIENSTHLALVSGELKREVPTLVRVHVQSGVSVLNYLREGSVWSLRRVFQTIGEMGGVLVVINNEVDSNELLNQIRHFQLDEKNPDADTDEASNDLRMLGIGGQILADVGVGKMRVIGSQRKMHALSGFDLEISEYISSVDQIGSSSK